MANVHNRTTASSSGSSSDRVRKLWKDFERTISSGRNVMEHKVSAAVGKAETEYQKMPDKSRVPTAQHEDMKTNLVKKIRQAHYEGVVAQWHTRLTQAGLKAEDWSDMTPEEMETVAQALGGGIDAHSDEDMVVVHPVVQPVPQTPFLSSYATSLFQRPIAPSFSTSTRTSNVSSISTTSNASSYAVVNPSEFHSEEEDDYFYGNMATSHETSGSEDDEGPAPSFVNPSRHNHFGGWNSSESSLHNSIDSLSSIPYARPLVSNTIQNMPTNGRSIPAGKTTSGPHTQNENAHASSSASAAAAPTKTKVRQTYIGPQLEDPNEPLSEADDFELFKMQTRLQKIVEFHHEAALAEIQLSIEIYKDRKPSSNEADVGTGERKEVSSRVVEHQKRMAQLQREKEDERKTTVKAERTKRRSELRTGGRPGRSNTIVAPVPSAPGNPSWLTSFQENVPTQVEANFDFEKILSEEPNERDGNVEQLLRDMFPDANSAASKNNILNATRNPEEYDSDPPSDLNYVPRWGMNSGMGMGMSSASASASNSSSRQPSRSQFQTYTSASAAAANTVHTTQHAKRKGKGKGRPSPFGEDSDSDSDSSDDDNNGNAHSSAAAAQTHDMNPFMHADMGDYLASQLQDDPVIAAAFAQYSGLGAGGGMERKSQSSSPPMQWGTRPVPDSYEQQAQVLLQQLRAQEQAQAHEQARARAQAPSAQPQASWAMKEVRATPVGSGWTRKRTGSIFTPEIPQTSISHTNVPSLNGNDAFGAPPQTDMFGSGSAAFGSHLASSTPTFASFPSTAAAKGKKPMAASMLEQQQQEQYAWEQDEQQHPSTKSSAMSGLFSSLSTTNNAKGKKSVLEQQQQQSLWDEPPKKATPPSTAMSKPSPASSAAAIAPAPAPAPAAPPKAEKAAPAPAPAQPAKKMNKKQRQAALKKGGPAAAAAVEEAEAESAPAPSQPEPEPEPVVVVEPPPQQHLEPPSLMSKMMPAMGIGRARKDSAPPAPSSGPGLFGWDDNAVTTPRPASKVPAHVHVQQQQQETGTPRPNLFKKYNTSDSVPGLGVNASGTGTIKPSQWGVNAGASASAGGGGSNKSIWNVFGGTAPSATSAAGKASQQTGVGSSVFGKNARVPGGFDVDDDGGGGDDDGGGGEEEAAEEEEESPQMRKGPISMWGSQAGKASATASAHQQQSQQAQQQQPQSAAQRFRRMSSAQSNIPIAKAPAPAPVPPAPVPAPVTQPAAAAAQATGKKGAKAKKNAKGKKATVEDVPDEENDSRGGILPVDSSSLLLPATPSPSKAVPSKVILEPKPSVAPRMFSSIIDYGDEGEEEGEEEDAYSSFAATPSTAPSSPPDLFGGDDARLAAAIKELQEGTSKMSKIHGGGGGGVSGGAWGSSASEKRQQQPQLAHATWTPSVSEAEQSSSILSSFGSRPGGKSGSTQQPQTPVWGQLSNKDKGKSKMTDLNAATEDSMKGPNHNMKRNKPAAGWL